ncbi:arginine--tRNA ligase [Candidatus Woesearchaeota archaeon]|nr:arginine--tRNA ligase [Candidatus Woesearchaeota archaeon]
MEFKQELVKIIVKETGLPEEEVGNLVAVPPDPKLGDYAFSCFKLGKNPKAEAEKLKQKIKLPSFISKAEVVGPYLNFVLSVPFVAKEIISPIRTKKEKFGAGQDRDSIVVEYCGPNTNKPLHLGHIRNMALGNAVCRLLSFQGNKVHPVNIVNDRGIHICQSMIAYQKWGKGKKPEKKGDHFVGDFYVLFSQKLKDDPNLKEEAQQMLWQWEYKNAEVRKLWKKMNSWVLHGFAKTYKRFGISFDKEYFESEIYEQGKEVAFEGLQKKVFVKDDSKNILASLEQYGLPNKVVLRGDGTSVYITQDLYLAQQRYLDYKFHNLIYVVASEQRLHFQQLFKILSLLERPFAEDLYHLSYGMVNLPTGRMKSREGMVIDADDLMDEMALLAEREVRTRYRDLSEKEIKQRAEFIGLAAIKFFMLKTDATRDMVFNPEESLSFEGETGPYLQYTHARACSILEKAGRIPLKAAFEVLIQPQERALVLFLSTFSNTVKEAAKQYKPHLLCRYLLDLAHVFNEFYHSCPVLSEEVKIKSARLTLVDAVRQILANGLNLLGIKALEKM